MSELYTTPLINLSTLKAYYRFETGALTTDSSGESHTLTGIGDPAEDSSGKFNGAVALDGDDAYSAVDHADFKPTGAFTIGGWLKTSTTGAQRSMFGSYSQNTDLAGIILYQTSGNKAAMLSAKNTGTTENTDYDTIVGDTTITDGVWHFIVGTWNTTHLNLYVDGSSNATAVAWANAPAYAATNYVRVGCLSSTGSNIQFITGSLDDVFLLNGKALSAAEVRELYYGYNSVVFGTNI